MRRDIALVFDNIVCSILLCAAFVFVLCNEWFGRRASD
jgi:hypothetical protein